LYEIQTLPSVSSATSSLRARSMALLGAAHLDEVVETVEANIRHI
jgi:hypothetical protein